MENDQGTRGLPASDGPLKGFLGGACRCAERATNLSAGQSGGSPSGELGRLTEMIARLEIQSASFEGRWRSASILPCIQLHPSKRTYICCTSTLLLRVRVRVVKVQDEALRL